MCTSGSIPLGKTPLGERKRAARMGVVPDWHAYDKLLFSMAFDL